MTSEIAKKVKKFPLQMHDDVKDSNGRGHLACIVRASFDPPRSINDPLHWKCDITQQNEQFWNGKQVNI